MITATQVLESGVSFLTTLMPDWRYYVVGLVIVGITVLIAGRFIFRKR